MSEPSFSVTVLGQLRAGGYRPRAWGRMLSDSWLQARSTARRHPPLVRGWRRITGELGVAMLCFVAYTAHRHGGRVARRSVPPLVVLTLLQAGDIYVHLGMHRDQSGNLHGTLGAAMYVTALRNWVGSAIGSRLLANQPLTDAESLAALLLQVVTDIADGRLARAQRLTSPLGRYCDGEADMLGWSALMLNQMQRGQIPRWYGMAYGLRWGLPLLLGFRRTFAAAVPVTLAPSRLGRTAGAAQVAVAASAVYASVRSHHADARVWGGLRRVLVAVSSVLLAATTIRHITRLLDR